MFNFFKSFFDKATGVATPVAFDSPLLDEFNSKRIARRRSTQQDALANTQPVGISYELPKHTVPNLELRTDPDQPNQSN